jgi:transposase
VALIPFVESKARLGQVDRQITEINAAIDRLIHSSDRLAHSMKILRSIPGIGAVCAATILIETPEIGSMDRMQVACLTGVVPMIPQSGQWRGKSFI